MIEATSCGGVVIFRGKILVLYKNYKNKYEGWVLPKGTVEPGEEYKETALREVKEETHIFILEYDKVEAENALRELGFNVAAVVSVETYEKKMSITYDQLFLYGEVEE